MKVKLRGMAARLSAMAASVVLVVVSIFSTGITVKASYSDPYDGVDFETYLEQQGFPESYKNELRELHNAFPNWRFEAWHTGLRWSDVIAAESRLGVNLTENSNVTSWKSLQQGAYDWERGEWITLDSGTWVAASEAIIAYYMDPRNLLEEPYIFQFLKMSYDPAQHTPDGVSAVVSGTFLDGLCEEDISYTDALINAAGISGVSPYTLAAMIIIEQGAGGGGNSISGTVTGYEGYYNFFNVGAYRDDSRGMDAVQRGLWYAKGGDDGGTSYERPWNTKTKSIMGGAEHFGENYIQKGQDTLYLKKFNVQGNNPYTHQYMTNVRGASIEASQMSQAYVGSAREANLVFKIPVYENMPENACVKPTDNSTPVKDGPQGPSDIGGGDSTGGTDTGGDENTGGTDTGEDENTGGTDTGGDENTGGTDTGEDENTGGTNTGGDENTGGTDTGGDDSAGGTDTGEDENTGGTDTGGDENTGGTDAGGTETNGTNDPTANPTDPDGEITLTDAVGDVGGQAQVQALVTTPSNIISSVNVIVTYDPDALELVENGQVSGGAGAAVISGGSGGASAEAAIDFNVLREGEHQISVSSYDVKMADEDQATLVKGSSTVTGITPEPVQTASLSGMTDNVGNLSPDLGNSDAAAGSASDNGDLVINTSPKGTTKLPSKAPVIQNKSKKVTVNNNSASKDAGKKYENKRAVTAASGNINIKRVGKGAVIVIAVGLICGLLYFFKGTILSFIKNLRK